MLCSDRKRHTPLHTSTISSLFAQTFGRPPTAIASAPGRLEVLGNHTDYNDGLTLSCAVGFRCTAGLAPLDQPTIQLKSTAFDGPPESFALSSPIALPAPGHWARYILGLIGGLQELGHTVPGFAMLIDSRVPRSAGVSSSAALEMAALTTLAAQMSLALPPAELARIGQWAESRAVGAQTGLLDQLTSLCGERDHLLHIDFQSLEHRAIIMPPGWVFVAVDSGVKHDLTADYNDRRASCEAAAAALGVTTLRDASREQLDAVRDAIDTSAYHCARHVLDENQRVREATRALAQSDIGRFGQLLFDSHRSSTEHFRNSCPELDVLVEHARQDPRCVGARLSGGGFGGISIHLVRAEDADAYRNNLIGHLDSEEQPRRWAAVCEIDGGAQGVML
ncbi:galactokinase [Phycisphaeraceae bacterium D3-23]